MGDSTQAINTTLCYLEKDGAWLMLHRVKKQQDMNKDKWIGVGGKFEPFESPEECLCREVQEETGLRLLDGLTEYMHLFTADQWEGEMIPGDACSEGVLEWVPKSRVPQLPIWEGDKIFFRLLEQQRPFFSLKLVYKGDELTEAVLDGKKLALEAAL